MTPTPGRIVEYTLTEHDVDIINRRRELRVATIGPGPDYAYARAGNDVAEGDTFPMVIVRVWGDTPEAAVNGQVLLDGNDTAWVTSRVQGPGAGEWRPFPTVGA